MMVGGSGGSCGASKKFPTVIEPNKCIIEDLEILAFDNEEQLLFYTLWHESLVDRRKGKNVPTFRPPKRAASSSVNTQAPVQLVTPRLATLQTPTPTPSRVAATSHQRQGSETLPNGLAVINTSTSQMDGKQVLRYKLNKMYSKLRGRQERRNHLYAKQVQARIEAEVSKSYLNPWLAYTALQALRLQGKQPIHLVYINPGNIISYSNRINPQQVAEYRQRAQRMPTSTMSKKSSAASYDVYEIMKVLTNTDKTNVTITRNSNRPNQAGDPNASVYSQSINANIPGIVSTQLHIQARSYLDMMRKFYAEERQRLERDKEAIDSLTDDEEDILSKYVDLAPPKFQAFTDASQ